MKSVNFSIELKFEIQLPMRDIIPLVHDFLFTSIFYRHYSFESILRKRRTCHQHSQTIISLNKHESATIKALLLRHI